MSDAPEVSVVVAAAGAGLEALGECLDSLAAECDERVELIACLDDEPDAALRERHPRVRFLAAQLQGRPEMRVFQLRRHAVAAARGRLVALIEDHCTVAPGWLAALRGALEAGELAAVGGPVDCGARRIREWGLYFFEYAVLMPPLPGGEVGLLSAVNCAYPRSSLEACRDVWQEGFYDNEVHDALRKSGHRLLLAPGAVVASHLSMRLGPGLTHAHAGGRRFGGYRRQRSSRLARALYALALPAVPVVLIARILSTVCRRAPRRIGWLLLSLPVLASHVAAWSLGEARGLLTGR